MNDSASYPSDKLAKLRSLAEVHEQLATELRMEVALLTETELPPASMMQAKAIARGLLAFRHRVRGAHVAALGDAFLQDPAMELLLEAFARQVENKPLSITGLHNHFESSQTTALRWGARMCDIGLATRTADPSDHRREWFALNADFFREIAFLLTQIVRASTSPTQ